MLFDAVAEDPTVELELDPVPTGYGLRGKPELEKSMELEVDAVPELPASEDVVLWPWYGGGL